MSAPDISAEAVEQTIRGLRSAAQDAIVPSQEDAIRDAMATLRALRAALDAAERERDEVYKQGFCEGYEDGEKAASAEGYARGVREAAGQCAAVANALHPAQVITDRCSAAILALLPASKTKETRDE